MNIFHILLIIIHHIFNLCAVLWFTGLSVFIHMYSLLKWSTSENSKDDWFPFPLLYKIMVEKSEMKLN